LAKNIQIFIYSLILLFFFRTNLHAQKYTIAEVKTVFIYQFGLNITWENEQNLKKFKIAIYGDNDEIYPAINQFAKNNTLKGKPIEVIKIKNIQELLRSNFQILYISQYRNYELSSILRHINNKNILVISDNSSQQKLIMINFINSEDKTIGFEINTKTIRDQNLNILPKLLLLGGTELDVKKLYKEQEIKLKEEKEKVEKLKDELINQKKLISELNIEIKQRLTELKKQKDEIIIQKKEIYNQKKELKNGKKNIANQSLLLKKRTNELLNKQAKILKKEKIIEEQNKKVETAKKTLELLTSKISYKEEEILKKEKKLGVQEVKIGKQQNLLFFAGIIVFIIIFLSTLLIRSIRGKQKINRELRYKNIEVVNKNTQIQDQADELLKHRNKLELLVEERTVDLIAAKEKAEESDRLKSAFLENMSHEIRTPMNAIIGFSNLLHNSEYDNEKRNELISYIVRSSDTLLHLINDIIDISKIEANQLIIEKKECSINNIFDDLIYMYDEKIKIVDNKNIEIKIIKSKKDDISLFTDNFRLQQVFINLINNALKFTEQGIIEVGYNIKESIKHQELTFHVKDSGIGITQEHQKKIFNRFFKLENETNKLYRGTGLGLSISKNIIELLGGKIWLSSELGKGSTFYFSIPIKNNK